ncbi:MAG: hypothetical protein II840_07580 [Kiritimatiellae bacterium]|nr:hypothetical protein [Kiritimatiellia bacterium]
MAKDNGKVKAITDLDRLTVPKGTWFKCDVKLWHSTCYLFVGTMDMLHASLTGAKKVSPPPKMDEAALEFAKKCVSNHLDARTDGDAFGDGTYAFIRLSNLCIGELGDMATLVHECLHAAAGILGAVGVKEVNGEEALAYTQEFLFKHFMEKALELRGLASAKAGRAMEREVSKKA